MREILDTLRPHIEAGIPLVGLEPSCLAVFRDELKNLMPHDEDARRLSQQSYLLSEFLEKKAPHYQPPQFKRKAIVHGHCHHKSIMKMHDEQAVLSKLRLDFQVLDSGCCGMAGAFGFEKDHYDISIKVGERVLLPAVRSADEETLIIADGFSCREQIAQMTDRHALHLAEVLHMAIQQKQDGTAGGLSEEGSRSTNPEHRDLSKLVPAALVSIGGLLIGGILIWQLKRKRGEQ